jgi:hypothetical protein
LADLTPKVLPPPLLVAEFGGIFDAEFGSLPADIEGEGDEVEELMPFVWIPGGIGLFVFASAWTVVADGAILQVSSAPKRRVPLPKLLAI